jgi:tetratricopeptide (TPR) repeat protein
MQLDKGEFNELAQNLLDIENGLEVFKEMIMNTDKLHFYCLLAYCYFGSGNFTEALKWINKFLNNKNVDKNSELYIKGKIINLIIHYELGNFELLNYLTDSLYRDSKRSKFTQYPQKVFINLMRQLPSISHQTKIKSLFEQSLNKLKKKSNSGKTGKPEETLFNPFEIQNNFSNVPEIDFESWFDSKINGKKFSDIVREKYLTSQKS